MLAACADAEAYKVVGFAHTTEAKPCREVPGAERIFTADERVVCLGDMRRAGM